MSDTFERSCAHWSEAKRAEMEAFYALASLDYRELAGAFDWAGWLRSAETKALACGRDRLTLLDVACGSGKFPSTLVSAGDLGKAGLAEIDYALLDPSSFSIAEARQALAPPFEPGTEYPIPLQTLDVPEGTFDIAWATHALYAVPGDDIDLAMQRMTAAVADKGVIAHARSDSHYLRFYDLYLESLGPATAQPYLSAENIKAALWRQGMPVETTTISYTNTCPEASPATVEGYLQRCLFDDQLTLEAMLENPYTGKYLQSCLNDGEWRFSQVVDLIFFSRSGA